MNYINYIMVIIWEDLLENRLSLDSEGLGGYVTYCICFEDMLLNIHPLVQSINSFEPQLFVVPAARVLFYI